jgi:hypothetical protein
MIPREQDGGRVRPPFFCNWQRIMSRLLQALSNEANNPNLEARKPKTTNK